MKKNRIISADMGKKEGIVKQREGKGENNHNWKHEDKFWLLGRKRTGKGIRGKQEREKKGSSFLNKI